jgi:transcriptional regulator
MKRTVFYLSFFVFVSLAQQGFAQKEFEKDVIGTWKINISATEKLTKEKNPATKDMPELVKKLFSAIRFEFQKGGKFKTYSANKEIKGQGSESTWSLENSIITLKNEKTGEIQRFNIVGVDLMELRLHDVNKNTYMVLETVFE